MKRLTLFLLVLSALSAFAAPVKVITSTTDLAWATKEIGGALVDVTPLLKGTENPHYVDAVPEFVRLAAEAQVALVIGLELEIGWIPKVLSRSGNSQVQPGGKGYCEVGKIIPVLEKPAGAVDRSMGDVHPAGNPHFWLSPKYLGIAAGEIAETLIKVDPSHAKDYHGGLAKLRAQLDELEMRARGRLAPLLAGKTGPVLIEYHKELAYFLDTYKLTSLGSIEEKPGVSPSAGRLAEIAQSAKAAGITLAVAGDTAPKKTLERFSELSGIPVQVVPLSVVPSKTPKDYPELHKALIDAIVVGLGGTKT